MGILDMDIETRPKPDKTMQKSELYIVQQMHYILYFSTHESQVTGILIAQKMQDKDLTKKCLQLAHRILSFV